MKEIYLINKGDSVEKAKVELQITGEYEISTDKILDKNYIELNDGLDDIILINNYLPYYIHKVQKGETLMDILSRGYCVDGINEVNESDLIVVSRPKSIRYVVKPLEKLDDIATKFNINKDIIIETNYLKSDKLFVGQILWI